MYIFDFDGTLVDSNHLWVDIDLKFLARRGLSITQEYTQFVIHSIFPIAAQYTKEYYHLAESAQDIMDEWMNMARRAYAEEAPLKPGAREFLEKCRRHGQTMALFTACQPELCMSALERTQLTGYFQDIVFAQELGVEKRDPQAFPMLGKRLSVPLDQCVLFDDSPTACTAARAAGLTVVGVHDDFYSSCEQEVRAASHRFITGFDQLLDEPFPPAIPGRTAAL